MLITVKTSPQPSTSYGGTVCVAGIEIIAGQAAGLVRLYPVRFRHLAGEHQFTKYQVIHADLSHARSDPRPESHNLDFSTLRLGGVVKGWPHRVHYVEPLIMSSADAFVLVHTHTTDAAPGADDAAVTRRMVAAAVVVGLPMVGHVVVGPERLWDCVTGTSWPRPAAAAASGRLVR